MGIHIIKSSYTSWLAYIEKNIFKIGKKYQNIHRKQVAESNSMKLIIILQNKKILILLKNDDVSNN